MLKLLCPHTPHMLAIGEEGKLVMVEEDGETMVPLSISRYVNASTPLEKEV